MAIFQRNFSIFVFITGMFFLFSATAQANTGANTNSQMNQAEQLKIPTKWADPLFLQPDNINWSWDASLTIVPVEGMLTSGFGPRKLSKKSPLRMHKGIDISAPRGSRIVASAGGEVIFAGRKNGYGNTVEIDHGNGLVTLYAHLDKMSVKKGELVEAGQNLGTVGRTGRTTGACLHFETIVDGQAQDPLLVAQWATFLAKADKKWTPVTRSHSANEIVARANVPKDLPGASASTARPQSPLKLANRGKPAMAGYQSTLP